MDLLQRTYELIDQSKLSRRQIAVGAGVERSWFRKFAKRDIPSPGVQKVQAVHDFLSNATRETNHAA
jgi:predicted XRE-type DNA-binding protein